MQKNKKISKMTAKEIEEKLGELRLKREAGSLYAEHLRRQLTTLRRREGGK